MSHENSTPFDRRAALTELNGEGVSRHIDAWEDPVLQGLGESLFASKAMPAGGYPFLHTLGAKFEIPADVLAEMQMKYHKQSADCRIFNALPDQIPGLRRLSVLPRIMSGRMDAMPVICVTDKGLLFARDVSIASGATPAQILDQLRNTLPDHRRSLSVFDFNRHAKSHREAALRLQVGNIIPMEFMESGHKSLHGLTNALRWISNKQAEKRLGIMTWSLLEGMDPEIVRMMRSTQKTSLYDALWFSGAVDPSDEQAQAYRGGDRLLGQSVHAFNDPQLAEARLQAVKTYPLLIRYFEGTKLGRSIDRREPLAPKVAHLLDMTPAQTKNLVGLTWQKYGHGVRVDLSDLRQLKNVPHPHFPKRRVEFAFISKLQLDVVRLGLDFDKVFSELSRGGSPYRYIEVSKNIHYNDIQDAVGDVVRRLLLPVALHAGERRAGGQGIGGIRSHHFWDFTRNLSNGLIRNLAYKDLLAMSDRWHRNLARHNLALNEFVASDTWDALSGDIPLKGGIIADEVVSASGMRQLGASEGHCVGGYVDQVITSTPRKTTLIYALKKDGAVVGTIELRGVRAEPKGKDQAASYGFTVIQNRGKKNKKVEKAVDMAGLQLCKALSRLPTEQIDHWLKGMADLASSRTSLDRLPKHISAAGYDIWDERKLAIAWEEYAPYLTKAMRKRGLEGLITHFQNHDELMQSLPISDGYSIDLRSRDLEAVELTRSGSVARPSVEELPEERFALFRDMAG